MCRDFGREFAVEREARGRAAAFGYALAAVWDLLVTASVEYGHMIVRDLRFALRSLRRTPLFTAIIVATLAVAIGANAAAFSILDAVVLAPLPYAHPDRLVAIDWYDGSEEIRVGSLADFADVERATGGIFANAAAFSSAQMTLAGVGAPRYENGAIATAGLFATLGTRPELGTFPARAQTRPGADPLVVLSDGFWRDTFGADPRVVGRLVRFDGTAYRVAAVAPPSFAEPSVGYGFSPVRIWRFVPDDGIGTPYPRDDHQFQVVARLRPGVSAASADAAVARVLERLRASDPATDATVSARIVSLADSLVGGQRVLFFGIFAAVVAVLFVACANVANLLLSRGASREREISVRTAIGASRGRIVAQLLVESFVLATAGGALGIAIASGIVAAFRTLHPASIPRADDVSLGLPTLLFTIGIVVVATVVAGLAPALTASKLDIATALKTAGRGGDAHRGARARDGFVATEIAITLAIVVAAGLVLRSFAALTAQPLGFDPTGLVALTRIDLPVARYGTDAAIDAYQQRALAAVRAVPGVRDAAWDRTIPFSGLTSSTSTGVVGRSYPPGMVPDAQFEIVSSRYFSVLGATVLAGRSFTDDDRHGALPVAIVNESFVRRFFPSGGALGARIVPEWGTTGAQQTTKRTIVGVVADIRSTLAAPAVPASYLPMRQMPVASAALVLRETPHADATGSAMRALEAVDPALPAPDATSVSALVARSVAAQRLGVVALGALAIVAIVLAAAGIFAVVSFGVTQRTHEFGIRMALGASGGSVLASVLLRALRLAAIGIAAGLVLAAACTRFLAGELFDTASIDPATFSLVTALIVAVALGAAIVPGLRATRVDPIVALRYE